MIDREALKALIAEAMREVLAEQRPTPGAEPLEDTTKLAQFVDASPQAITKLCRSGRVAGAVRLGRSWRARRSDVLAALQAGQPAIVNVRERAAKLLAGGRR